MQGQELAQEIAKDLIAQERAFFIDILLYTLSSMGGLFAFAVTIIFKRFNIVFEKIDKEDEKRDQEHKELQGQIHKNSIAIERHCKK